MIEAVHINKLKRWAEQQGWLLIFAAEGQILYLLSDGSQVQVEFDSNDFFVVGVEVVYA